ncbi:unnamed protein product [Closterium sp. Yama58-4]|nr:unnamed protein product [Closterium sp. Yama58-4]
MAISSERESSRFKNMISSFRKERGTRRREMEPALCLLKSHSLQPGFELSRLGESGNIISFTPRPSLELTQATPGVLANGGVGEPIEVVTRQKTAAENHRRQQSCGGQGPAGNGDGYKPSILTAMKEQPLSCDGPARAAAAPWGGEYIEAFRSARVEDNLKNHLKDNLQVKDEECQVDEQHREVDAPGTLKISVVPERIQGGFQGEAGPMAKCDDLTAAAMIADSIETPNSVMVNAETTLSVGSESPAVSNEDAPADCGGVESGGWEGNARRSDGECAGESGEEAAEGGARSSGWGEGDAKAAKEAGAEVDETVDGGPESERRARFRERVSLPQLNLRLTALPLLRAESSGSPKTKEQEEAALWTEECGTQRREGQQGRRGEGGADGSADAGKADEGKADEFAEGGIVSCPARIGPPSSSLLSPSVRRPSQSTPQTPVGGENNRFRTGFGRDGHKAGNGGTSRRTGGEGAWGKRAEQGGGDGGGTGALRAALRVALGKMPGA